MKGEQREGQERSVEGEGRAQSKEEWKENKRRARGRKQKENNIKKGKKSER